MTVYVTRPDPDAARTCAALREAGVEAIPAPLMHITPLDAPLPEIADNTVLAFTSANGVRAWQAKGGPARPAFVVGDATARAAEKAGLKVEGIGGGDVDRLLKLVQEKAAGRPVLHIRGLHSTGDLAARLEAAGLRARALELYEAKAAEALPAALREGLETSGNGVAVFSPRTMRLFLHLTEAAGLLDRLGGVTAYCLSRAVADAAGAIRFSDVVISEQPSLPAFVDRVRSDRT